MKKGQCYKGDMK